MQGFFGFVLSKAYMYRSSYTFTWLINTVDFFIIIGNIGHPFINIFKRIFEDNKFSKPLNKENMHLKPTSSGIPSCNTRCEIEKKCVIYVILWGAHHLIVSQIFTPSIQTNYMYLIHAAIPTIYTYILILIYFGWNASSKCFLQMLWNIEIQWFLWKGICFESHCSKENHMWKFPEADASSTKIHNACSMRVP